MGVHPGSDIRGGISISGSTRSRPRAHDAGMHEHRSVPRIRSVPRTHGHPRRPVPAGTRRDAGERRARGAAPAHRRPRTGPAPGSPGLQRGAPRPGALCPAPDHDLRHDGDRDPRARRRGPRHRPGRLPGGHGPVRLRQDHPAAHPRRDPAPHLRHRPARRHRSRRSRRPSAHPTAPQRLRLRLPGWSAAARAHGHRERDPAAHARGRLPPYRDRRGRRLARPAGPAGHARAPAHPALRRAGSARGHRPRPRRAPLGGLRR